MSEHLATDGLVLLVAHQSHGVNGARIRQLELGLMEVPVWDRFLRCRSDGQCVSRSAPPGQLANPLMFFIMVTTLFPLALNPSPLFEAIAPGVVWVAALLASLLASESLFRPGRGRRHHGTACVVGSR